MGVKPVVVRSINDPGAQRCVDILRAGGLFGWVECRRDPEDAHGWRPLAPPTMGFDTSAAALSAAKAATGWMTP